MLNLREVKKEDMELLFDWVNNLDVRINAINNESITWKDHVSWFNEKIQDPLCHIYILEDSKKSIGMIRFDNTPEGFLITYSIDESFRNKGFGELILKNGIQVMNSLVDKPVFIAYVKSNNIPSLKIFDKFGFIFKESKIINNNEFKIFQKSY